VNVVVKEDSVQLREKYMNIVFKSKIYFCPEFFDFLLSLLKPTKITPTSTSYGSYSSISIKGATLMSLTELERKLREWSKKKWNESDINFELESIELTEKEKKKIDSVIVFEKVGH